MGALAVGGGRAWEAALGGVGAVNQGQNIWSQKGQTFDNRRNAYLDQNLNRVELSSTLQVCDRAFFRRGDRWVDGNSVIAKSLKPHEIVEFGGARYFDLTSRLVREGKGGVISMKGEILLEIDGKNVLFRAAPAQSKTAGEQTQNPKPVTNPNPNQEVIR